MTTGRLIGWGLVAAAVLVGASFLPIDAERVRSLTATRLVLQAVGDGAGGRSFPRGVDVRVGTTADRDGVARALPTVGDPAPDATPLALTFERQRDRLVVTGRDGEREFRHGARLGDWRSLLTPLVALLLALALRHVIVALLTAVWVGAWVVRGAGPLDGVVGTLTDYLWPVLTDGFNLRILAFAFALVGMVAVVSRMGGTRGLVDKLAPWARGPRSTQAVTGLMGTVVFFDDYANTVVVGTSARALTDARGLSRAKLAYIVDSTSAPVAGIAIVSTWIGYEVGLFDSLRPELSAVAGLPANGYSLFLEIIPLRFYCLFALAMVFLVAVSGRDFGPMLAAERRARAGNIGSDDGEGGGRSLEKPGVTARWYNAALPVGVVLGVVFAAILAIGLDAVPEDTSAASLRFWQAVFSAAGHEIGSILLWASVGGSAIAIGLATGQRLLTLREAITAYGQGLSTLLHAGTVLVLAWAIKAVCDDLGTGLSLVALLGERLPAVGVPLAVFLLAGAVAFATGTSWGTMALLLPVAAPLSVGLSGDPLIVAASLGAVLDGAIWGDHCSPISDTTVLSSSATGCPHVEHVRTQFPYAMMAMLAAGGFGYAGYPLGLPLIACYAGGIALLAAAVWGLGRSAAAQTFNREPPPPMPPP